MTITHAEILNRIARPWIDIIPSRRTLAKRALPANAHEPGPNVIVVALPADRTTLEICGQFRLRHWKPRFNPAHIPGEYVWQFLTPSGERLMLSTWVNWQKNSLHLFEEFCRETGRETGTLSPDGIITLGERTLPFAECRLVHEHEVQPRQPATVKLQSDKAVLSAAARLLKRRTSQREELDCRELRGDMEAHDEELQARLEETFRANLDRYENILTKHYGQPAQDGPDEHPDIPINGVLRHVIWAVGTKSLYLALSHEDRELPWVTWLGVNV